MNQLWRFCAEMSQWTTLHILAFGVVLMGLFICLTANELGPLAPFFVSSGVYLVLFGLLLEVLMSVRLLLSRVATRKIHASNRL